jgi:DNA replication initiation complex subunit (GINS family)
MLKLIQKYQKSQRTILKIHQKFYSKIRVLKIENWKSINSTNSI